MRARAFAFVAVAALTTACSILFGVDRDDYASGAPDGAVDPDQAVPDAGPDIPTTTSDAARSLHLYVLGGSVLLNDNLVNTVPTDKVYYAPIDANGDVGAFKETTRLPVPVRAHAAVADADFLYVLGGESNQGDTDAVYAARVQDDGTLGAWEQTGTRLAGARNRHVAVALGRRVYVAGGIGPSGRYDDILVAELNEGKTGPFTQAQKLDVPNYAFAGVGEGSRLHFMGGLNDDGGTRTTSLTYSVTASGSLLPPEIEAPLLPGGACYHAAAVANGSIVSVGAVKQGVVLVTAEVAIGKLDAEGKVTAFTSGTSLPNVLWSHAVASAGGRVYVTGGLGPNAKPRYDHVLVGFGDPLVWKESENRLPQSLAAHAAVIQ